MKRLFLSVSVLLAGTALAAAADLPGRAGPAAPVVVVPAFSWTGFYAGVHGAWIRDEGEAVRTGLSGVFPDALPSRAGLSDSGPGGGAQIGYLWDFGSLVAGLEADLTVVDLERARSDGSVDGPFSLRTDLSSQMSLFGSVKGRLGLALPGLVPFVERSLLYVTGGLAYARTEHRGQITVTPPAVGPQAGGEGWKTGFVIGAGTEHALSKSVSLKAETLYYDLEDETLTLARAGDRALYRFENDGWISRVGVNVRF